MGLGGLGWDEKEGARWPAPTTRTVVRAGLEWVSCAMIGVNSMHIATTEACCALAPCRCQMGKEEKRSRPLSCPKRLGIGRPVVVVRMTATDL